MMAHVKIVDRWEKGKPTPVPDDARIRAYRGGEMFNPFFANVYVDDHLLMRVQHSDHDTQYDCVNRSGLASLRPRALIRAGGDRRHADPSAKKEHRLEHHHRRPGIYHQLAHNENLLDTRKN